jgi:hypothetical protein
MRSLNEISESSFAKAFKVGSKNAAVLPEPVWLDTRRSLPSSAAGIACSCTGVGVVKPKPSIAWIKDASREKSAKVLLIESVHPEVGAPLNKLQYGHRQKAAQQIELKN